MADAEAVLGFAPLVPTELGPPDAVQVSAGRRLVSMSWTGGRDGTVRLDQWAAGLDGLFAKTAPGVRLTSVGGDFAIWFDAPHEVVLLTDDHGGTRREPPRLAGHTLIWQTEHETLRLEGDLTLERALAIAASARPAALRNQEQRGGVTGVGVALPEVAMRAPRALLVVLITALLGVFAVALAPPSSAGGPTSVLLVDPDNGRATALYSSDPRYQRLSDLLGAMSSPASDGSAPTLAGGNWSPGSGGITVTWLMHDVAVGGSTTSSSGAAPCRSPA